MSKDAHSLFTALFDRFWSATARERSEWVGQRSLNWFSCVFPPVCCLQYSNPRNFSSQRNLTQIASTCIQPYSADIAFTSCCIPRAAFVGWTSFFKLVAFEAGRGATSMLLFPPGPPVQRLFSRRLTVDCRIRYNKCISNTTASLCTTQALTAV